MTKGAEWPSGGVGGAPHEITVGSENAIRISTDSINSQEVDCADDRPLRECSKEKIVETMQLDPEDSSDYVSGAICSKIGRLLRNL